MELALRGIIIGLSLAAPIGPINVEIVRRGLRSGFRSGWLVGAGAVTGDTIYCLLVIAGLAPLVDYQIVRTVLWIAGAGFLAFLGVVSLRAAIGRERMLGDGAVRVEQKSFKTGLLMALFNPMGIAFWLTIGGALVATGVERTDAAGTGVLVVGVIMGLTLWVTSLSALVHGGRRFVSDGLFRIVNFCSAALLFGFAAWFASQAFDALV